MDTNIPVSYDTNSSLIIRPHDLGSAQTRPTLFFARHAESTGNLRARLQGSRIGGTLSDRGQKQSEATAQHLFESFDELRRGNVRLVSSSILACFTNGNADR